MPCEIQLDQWEMDCDLLRAVTPSAEVKSACYPYPELVLTGERRTMALRVAILKNEFVEAVIALDLGGRLISFVDRANQVSLIARPPEIRLASGGPRGVVWRHGLEIEVGTRGRMNALGPVEFEILESPEGEVVDLLIHELIPGDRLSWHGRWSLSADSAVLSLDFRLINRSTELFLGPKPVTSGLSVHLPGELHRTTFGATHYDLSHKRGLGLVFQHGQFNEGSENGIFRKRSDTDPLMPHQTDEWSLLLVPFVGHSAPPHVSGEASCSLHEGVITLQPVRPVPNGKALAITRAHQVLEAPLNLGPMHQAKLNLGPMADEAHAVQIKYEDGQRGQAFALDHPVFAFHGAILDENDPALHLHDGCKRAAAWIQQAERAIVEQDWQRADANLERALLFNGDDTLAWWMRSAVARHSGDESEDLPYLPNAHFLGPMEPLLRIESFLRTPLQEGAGPSPLLQALSKHPEAQVEVVCNLLESGFQRDAARVIGELLRFGEHPMLRYLNAWNLLQHTDLKLDAADSVRRVEEVPIDPPYPSRSIEVRAIHDLRRAFPWSNRLGALDALVHAQLI